jgi:drug/metabolite transporter (DMT)-like permease
MVSIVCLTFKGNLLVLGAAVVNSANVIVQRKLMDDGCPPLTVSTWVALFGGILFVIVYAPLGFLSAEAWTMDTSAWIAVLITGLVATALVWLLNAWSLQRVSNTLYSDCIGVIDEVIIEVYLLV